MSASPKPNILTNADVIVVGGGLAGMATALRARAGGLTVVVLEARSYLGWEIGGWGRPWAGPEDFLC